MIAESLQFYLDSTLTSQRNQRRLTAHRIFAELVFLRNRVIPQPIVITRTAKTKARDEKSRPGHDFHPLIPKRKPSKKGGRKRVEDRRCFEGILSWDETFSDGTFSPAKRPTAMACGCGSRSAGSS
jgi:hypothetical protein